MMRGAVALVVASLLAGCSLAPKYARPQLPVPASWPVGDPYLQQSEAALPSLTYRDVFTDPRLQAIIAQALANNRDLRVAAANIIAARAQYRIQRAGLFPEVAASAAYSYSGGGDGANRAVGGGVGGNAGTGSGGGGTGSGTSTGAGAGTGSPITSTRLGSAYSVDLGVNAFEIDLFGRVRSLTGAALNRYFETEAAARATRLTLVGEVANAWLTYAADLSLLKISQDTAANAQRSVDLTRARLRGGIAPRSDLSQAQTVFATAQADLARQRTALAQDVNALQLLVGAPVDPAGLPASIEDAGKTLALLPAGLDSRILLRRPDVVQAEYELRAANAEIGAARADLFPRISLTAGLGYASTALTSLFSGGAFSYSVAPNITYPIFRAGAGIAGVRYSQAQRDAAIATYEKTIQTAFQETANALARQGTVAEQLRADQSLQAAAADALLLANARYRGGVDTFLNSLVAQRSLYTAQQALVAIQLTAASNRVALYTALGGDATLEVASGGPIPVSASGASRSEAPSPSGSPARRR